MDNSKVYYILLICAVLFLGCVDRFAGDSDAMSDRAIVLSSDVANTDRSKAVVENTTALEGIQFLRKDGTGSAPSDFSGASVVVGDRATSGSITFTPTVPTYKVNNDKCYFRAYHPVGVVSSDAVTWAVDGMRDIVVSSVFNAGNYAAPITGPMIFRHVLAQLEVHCVVDPSVLVSETAVQGAWGKVTKVELLDSYASAAFDYATGVTSGSGSLGSVALANSTYSGAFVATALTKAGFTASGMLVAASAGTAPLKLRITTERGSAQDVEVQLKSGATEKGFEAGLRHTITLQFGLTDKPIEVTGTEISEWDLGAGASANLDPPVALTYDSPSATTPVEKDATSVAFTVTGPAGITLRFAKTSGGGDFSTPADHTCNGTAQTVMVTMAANTGGGPREAVYSATAINSGASKLNLLDITVKQKGVWVFIDQLCWATGALVVDGANGCKIGASTDAGLYFHFGSLVGWSGGATGDGVGTGSSALALKVQPVGYTGSTAWPAGYYTGGTAGTGYGLPAADDAVTGIGDPCRYYLGAPWRTPTAAEYKTLFAGVAKKTVWASISGWDWQATPAGAIGPNSLFLPASGTRVRSDGTFYGVGSNGYCWSSSVYTATNGYSLSFSSDYIGSQSDSDRSYGFPVRCVKGSTTPNPPAESDYVTINNLKWAKGNLIAVNNSECKVGAPTDDGLYFQFGSLVGWSGGATGDGVGATNTSLATAVQVKPATYSGGTAWTTVDHYTDQGAVGTGYCLPGSDSPSTGIGDPCRYYLGAPWRTPTAAEYLTLLDASGDNTNKAVPLKVNNYDLSFPASGRRNSSDGTFNNVGSYGHCWSSSVEIPQYGCYLRFYSGFVSPKGNSNLSRGVPVRCVSSVL